MYANIIETRPRTHIRSSASKAYTIGCSNLSNANQTLVIQIQIQIQIQNIFIEHNTWVYIENQEYKTQMGLFNSTITKHHIVAFDLSFALEKTNWVNRCR